MHLFVFFHPKVLQIVQQEQTKRTALEARLHSQLLLQSESMVSKVITKLITFRTEHLLTHIIFIVLVHTTGGNGTEAAPNRGQGRSQRLALPTPSTKHWQHHHHNRHHRPTPTHRRDTLHAQPIRWRNSNSPPVADRHRGCLSPMVAEWCTGVEE